MTTHGKIPGIQQLMHRLNDLMSDMNLFLKASKSTNKASKPKKSVKKKGKSKSKAGRGKKAKKSTKKTQRRQRRRPRPGNKSFGTYGMLRHSTPGCSHCVRKTEHLDPPMTKNKNDTV